MGKKPDGRGGQRVVAGGSVVLDSDGAFSMLAMPATYHLHVSIGGKTGTWIRLRADGAIPLNPNEKVNRRFAIETGQLRVRIRRPDRTPITGLRIQLANVSKSWGTFTPATDARGECFMEFVPIDIIRTGSRS